MQHLSALDALFLYLETPETPMHVGNLILFEAPKGHRGSFYPNIRRHIESRLHLAPIFSRKLAFMPFDLANPIWVEDDAVDLDWHIQSLTLPKPGTYTQLEAAVAKLHEGMLDRDRPLWQFTVIEGLQSGEIAFTSRVHHAGLDGQGGVALAQAILDVEPKPAPRNVGRAEAKPSMPPSAANMLSAALRNSVAQYGKILKAGASAVKTVAGAASAAGAAGVRALSSSQARKAGAPTEQLQGMAGIANMTAMAEFAGNVSKLKASDTPLQAAKKLLPRGMKLGPRTPLNVAITGKRSFATSRVPLDEAKAIAKHFDVKLNDVVLATVAGALRALYAKDKRILAKAFIGAVPASLRAAGDTSQNNQVTMMLVNMATNIADPAKRMAAIRDASTAAKMLTGSMKGAMTTVTSDLPSLGIPWLMSIITPLYKTAIATNRIPVVANLVISNVPGPPMPLYMAGARMKTYFPVSIVTHGMALNITIHSYAGSLDYGLIAAKDQVPNLAAFTKAIEAAHEELKSFLDKPFEVKMAENARGLETLKKSRVKKVAKALVKKTVVKKTVVKKAKSPSSKRVIAAAPAAAKVKTKRGVKVGAKVGAKDGAKGGTKRG
jgi:diacylglycerol O-acyltransferase / wax synthase